MVKAKNVCGTSTANTSDHGHVSCNCCKPSTLLTGATQGKPRNDYSGYVATNSVNDIQFVNAVVGFMVVDTVAPVGSVYRTIDGGNDWQLLTTPTNAGLNALAVVNENLAYVVGNASGGSAVILKSVDKTPPLELGAYHKLPVRCVEITCNCSLRVHASAGTLGAKSNG
jgi:hypothetical protein